MRNLFLFLLLLLYPDQSDAQKKIYIITDLEGASGVYKHEQCWDTKGTPLYEQACEYLMGDINAVVRGLRDGGATEILVVDGHGPQTVIPHLMEPGAKHVTGKPRMKSAEWSVNESYAGLVLIGAHAMRGTPDGVLNHTQSAWNRYWYNGVETGEIGQAAAIAGHYGVPAIMVTGDEAVCREAKRFFGENCVTVPVKKGIARYAAILYPFDDTRKALYEGARQAMEAIRLCKPYVIETPVKAKKQFLDPNPAFQDYLSKEPYWDSKLVTKEGTIQDILQLYDF